MLAPVPAPITLLWRLVNKRRYQRHTEAFRGTHPRRQPGHAPRRVLALGLGLGFGIPGFIGTRLCAGARDLAVPRLPAYGEGPFERVGIPTTVPLLVRLPGRLAAEVGLGALLLANWWPALWLSFALLRSIWPTARDSHCVRLRARRGAVGLTIAVLTPGW